MKIQNDRMYLLFLGLLATAPPLATDMYLPAIPDIAKLWGIHESQVNLSLVLWFVSFSLSLLLCGSISDKYGRKPTLFYGLSLFILASGLCAGATNVWQLIAFRILQGLGAAAPSAMSMAICRDRFTGRHRQMMLAYIGVVIAVMPMLAPIIGSTLLSVVSWRWIFITQGLIAALSLLFTFGYEETAQQLLSTPLWSVFARYKRLFYKREYLFSCMAMGIITGPFFGYIGLSPIVYLNIFQLSKTMFSLFFGLNALASMMGSLMCAKLTRYFSTTQLLTAGFIGCFVGGLQILFFGYISAFTFFVGMMIFSFFCGMSRPISNHLVLEQVREDIGSASSFLVFFQIMVGAICMWIATLPWSHPILAFGVLSVLVPLSLLSIWPSLLRLLHKSGHMPT